MKKQLLFLSLLAFTLTGCNTVLVLTLSDLLWLGFIYLVVSAAVSIDTSMKINWPYKYALALNVFLTPLIGVIIFLVKKEKKEKDGTTN